MDETSFQELVLGLHRDGKWREIVGLGETEDKYQGRRLLWVWPSLNDLDWLKELLHRYKFKGIASIGCGSGLLEWIIQRHSGCNVIGVEKDKSWWHCRYSPPAFLKDTIYIDDEDVKIPIPVDYALLFCYFNNGAAFENYLSGCYEGRVVIVIGPRQGINRTTDPLPFDHKFNRLGWNLGDTRQLDNGKDLAVLYTK